jgi:ariadne-2
MVCWYAILNKKKKRFIYDYYYNLILTIINPDIFVADLRSNQTSELFLIRNKKRIKVMTAIQNENNESVSVEDASTLSKSPNEISLKQNETKSSDTACSSSASSSNDEHSNQTDNENENDNYDEYDDDFNNNYICDNEDDFYDHDDNDVDVDIIDDHELIQNDPEYFEYETLPIEKIDLITKTKCEKVQSYLKLDDPLDAVYILKQLKWNPNKIIELYDQDKHHFLKTYLNDNNNNNSSQIMSKSRLTHYINIYNQSTLQLNSSKVSPDCTKSLCMNKSKELFCNICCSTKTNFDTEMIGLDECSHYFCLDCWSMHFESLINSAQSSNFECMQTKCNVIANKEFVLRCLTSNNSSNNTSGSYSDHKDKLVERYKKLITVDLIKESDDLQLCPGEVLSCQKAYSEPKISLTSKFSTISSAYSSSLSSKLESKASIKSDNVSTTTKLCNHVVWIKSKPAARRVLCNSCNNQYCFLCSLPYHAPTSCQIIRSWNLKCQDDSETRNYLLAHTQDCPKCKVCIEKNGGCSHMTCNRCKHEFCWVCLQDWKIHGATYDCNRYKGNPEQDNAREALNRYTHYYHRWINHANSLKLEKAYKEHCQSKINEKIISKGCGTLVDWEFFTEAVDTLTRARYTLQYTYPFAYYLSNNEQKFLFENIQAELEREVENLSHSLEKVDLTDKFNIRTQMCIVEKRRKTLLKDFIK